MKRLIILTLVLIGASILTETMAQRAMNRDEFLTEVRNFKRQVLTTELSLTKEQEEPFFTAYEAMDGELRQLSEDLRKMQANVLGNEEATDIEVEAAARALYEQSAREGEIQMRYYDTFREILTPQQLLKLRAAERKCTQQMMQHHGRSKRQQK